MPVYKVTVEYDFYVEAESPCVAEDYCCDAASDLCLRDYAFTEEVDANNAPKDEETLTSLVYGPEADTPLREALAAAGVVLK